MPKSANSPASPAPAPAEPPPSAETPAAEVPDTEHVTRSEYTNEVSGIHQQLDEMKQSIAHLLNAQQIGEGQHAGHGASEPGTGTTAGQSQSAEVSASAGGAGQQVGGTAEAELIEPEHAPSPSHWYWKSLRGR